MVTVILLHLLIICWIVFVIRHWREKKAWLQGITACCLCIVAAYSSLLWHEYNVEDNAYIYGEEVYRVIVLDDPIRFMLTSHERTRDYLHKMEEDKNKPDFNIMRSALRHAPLGYFISIKPQILADGPEAYRSRIYNEAMSDIMRNFNEFNKRDDSEDDEEQDDDK